MRKLVTIRTVSELKPIENADNIELAVVDGWQCVVKKGEFNVGDLGVYFEIDSWMPYSDERFKFLMKNVRHFEDVPGVRIKTMRLRGALSQGLFMPLSAFPEILVKWKEINQNETDVSELIGIKKWERPIPGNLSGKVRGNFPSRIRKTDQERIQNLKYEVFEKHKDTEFEVTIKLDGSSMTVYCDVDGQGVCSRNLDFFETEENYFWQAARNQNLLTPLVSLCNSQGVNLALQGELVGQGVCSNNEKMPNRRFYLFDIWDIDNHVYLSPTEREKIALELKDIGADIDVVPTLGMLKPSDIGNLDAMLKFAEGPSMNQSVQREGLVWKSIDGKFSFKVISNAYLLKEKD